MVAQSIGCHAPVTTILQGLRILAVLIAAVGLLWEGTCLAEPMSGTSAVDKPATEAGSSAALLKQRTAEVTGALQKYRESLVRLLAIYEQTLATSAEKQRSWKELYERGTISRREFEKADEAVATVQSKVDQTTREIAAADHAIAEAMTMEALAALPPPTANEPQHTPALSRYQGRVVWTLQAITPRL